MKTDILRNTEIFVFLAMVFSIFTAVLLTKNGQYEKEKIAKKEKEKTVVKEKEDLEIKLDSLILRTEFYESKLAKHVNNTLPHIELNGAEEFNFPSRESVIPEDFATYLNDSIVPKLATYIEQCSGCNAIYIVGHTDNQSVGKTHRNLNFDEDVYNSLRLKKYHNIEYNSNTDLGLLRAVSIYHFLKNYESINNKIKHWFPMSSGPLIDPDTGKLSNDIIFKEGDNENNKKRRIEIWLYAYKK